MVWKYGKKHKGVGRWVKLRCRNLVWDLPRTDEEAQRGDMLSLGWPSFPVAAPGGIPTFCSWEAGSPCVLGPVLAKLERKLINAGKSAGSPVFASKAAITRYHKLSSLKARQWIDPKTLHCPFLPKEYSSLLRPFAHLDRNPCLQGDIRWQN